MHPVPDHNAHRRNGAWHRFAFTMFVLLAVSWSKGYSQTKPAFTVVGTAATIASIGSYGAGHVSANSLGDVFYTDQKVSTGYYVPHGTTTPVALISGLSGGRNAYVDSSNNAYFPSNYSGYVVKVPYSNGSYTTGTTLSAVTANCTATSTTPCRALTSTSMGSTNTVIGGYYQPTDLSIDGAGNVYVLECSDSTGVTGNKVIKLVPASTSGLLTYTASLVVNLGASNTSAELAVDKSGNIYYTNKTTLYTVLAGTSTATAFGSYGTPAGVSVDGFGNVFVSDSSTKYSFYEFPAVNGVANTSVQYTAFYGYSGNGIAFDGQGHYFSIGYSSGNVMNKNSIYGYDFGSGPIGTSLGTQSFTLTYTGSYTPATIQMSGLSSSAFTYTAGTCVAGTAVSQGSNCTVKISYTPTAVGLQRGALVLLDSSGNQIGAVPVSGTGTGALQTMDPGVQSKIGNGWKSPQGIDVDASGAIYVADAGANAVYRYASTVDEAPSQIGNGLSAPTDVKIDAAGNAYIADGGNGRIVKVPVVNGALTNTAQSVLYSGIASNAGLALDRNANLYVADAGNARVFEIAAAGGAPHTSYIRTIGAGFNSPVAVATDSAGNVYVVDSAASSSNDVTKVVSAGGAQNLVGTGYSNPAGIAVDASGSVYVGDAGNNRLIKIPSEGGAINANDATMVGGTIVAPHGVALDGSANIYVTDSANGVVAKIARTQGVLPLGSANLNETTAQQAAKVTNAGNSALTFASPAYTVSGDTSYFIVSAPSTNGCTAALLLSSGSACAIAATFTPTARGSYSELLAFASNATNSASSTLTLTGKGTYIAPTTLALTKTSPAGQPVYGQSITVQANLSYTLNGTDAATGAITFYIDAAQYKQPITIANNSASITITGLSASTHSIGASYGGDDNYASSSASTISLSIARLSSSTVLTSITGLSTNPTSAAPGTSLTYAAKVVPAGAVAPTGTVSFYAGTVLLGAGPVSGSKDKTSDTYVYTATLTTTATPTGIESITAAYNGDVNYLSSSSDAQSVNITPAAYVLAATSGTVSASSGSSGSTNIVVTSYSGYNARIAFVCSGLPASSQCSFSPNNFALVSGTPQTVTLQILVNQSKTETPPTVGLVQRRGAPLAFAALLPLGLLGLRRVRRSARGLLGAVLLAALLAGGAQCLTGCGGLLYNSTPRGTYAVTVTAYGTNTSTNVTTTQTSTVSLTVQ